MNGRKGRIEDEMNEENPMTKTDEYGPQTAEVQAIIDRFGKLTTEERKQLAALRDDAFWAAWNVARAGRAYRAGLGAARYALRDRLHGWSDDRTAYGAALAVLLRHTIDETFTREHYDALLRPWVTVTGMPGHPDDVPTSDALPVGDELSDLRRWNETARIVLEGVTVQGQPALAFIDRVLEVSRG